MPSTAGANLHPSLHATSVAFYDQLAKVKPSADPYPPSGSSKDKLRVSEALGLVMIDYGNDAGGAYGKARRNSFGARRRGHSYD